MLIELRRGRCPGNDPVIRGCPSDPGSGGGVLVTVGPDLFISGRSSGSEGGACLRAALLPLLPSPLSRGAFSSWKGGAEGAGDRSCGGVTQGGSLQAEEEQDPEKS